MFSVLSIIASIWIITQIELILGKYWNLVRSNDDMFNVQCFNKIKIIIVFVFEMINKLKIIQQTSSTAIDSFYYKFVHWMHQTIWDWCISLVLSKPFQNDFNKFSNPQFVECEFYSNVDQFSEITKPSWSLKMKIQMQTQYSLYLQLLATMWFWFSCEVIEKQWNMVLLILLAIGIDFAS